MHLLTRPHTHLRLSCFLSLFYTHPEHILLPFDVLNTFLTTYFPDWPPCICSRVLSSSLPPAHSHSHTHAYMLTPSTLLQSPAAHLVTHRLSADTVAPTFYRSHSSLTHITHIYFLSQSLEPHGMCHFSLGCFHLTFQHNPPQAINVLQKLACCPWLTIFEPSLAQGLFYLLECLGGMRDGTCIEMSL